MGDVKRFFEMIVPPPKLTEDQRGVALVFVLLIMAIAMTAALFAVRSILLGDKASQNDRDRQVAFQAAELALGDAELDIMDAELAMVPGSKSRGCELGPDFVGVDPGCHASGAKRGICGFSLDLVKPGSQPLHTQVDWEDTDDSTRTYALFGELTGRSAELRTGESLESGERLMPPTPSKPPKYVILEGPRGQEAGLPLVGYKVYALGYGVSPHTKVMLEADFIKPTVEKICRGA